MNKFYGSFLCKLIPMCSNIFVGGSHMNRKVYNLKPKFLPLFHSYLCKKKF